MDVSIIIVNYNTKSLTSNCIDSIFEQTKDIQFEIILVDNGSSDGSRELFSKDERIIYIFSEDNLGFGRANNLGYKIAKGEYLFLLNSDTYLVNNAIYLLWKQLKDVSTNSASGEVACAGCILTDEHGKVVHSYAHFPSMWFSLLGATIYPVLWKLHIIPCLPSTSNYGYGSQKGNFFDVDYITGADLMVRKRVADELKLFDPEFFMYYEETEMQYRYMKAGYRRIVYLGPQIVHLEGQSNRKSSPARTTQAMRSLFLYYKKTGKPLSYLLFSLSFKFSHILTCLVSFPFMNGNVKDKINHIWEIIRI